jgi:hypothetical protein
VRRVARYTLVSTRHLPDGGMQTGSATFVAPDDATAIVSAREAPADMVVADAGSLTLIDSQQQIVWRASRPDAVTSYGVRYKRE